jgi:predicted transcriptional regulator
VTVIKFFPSESKDETVNALDELALQTNRSRNDLINFLPEHAVKRAEIV